MHKKQTQSGRFLGTSMFATLLVISMFFQAKGCLKIPPSAISHHFTAQHSSIWSKISSAHRIASKNGTDGWRNPRRCQISSYKAEPFIRGLISPLGKRDEALDSKRRPARDYYQPLEKLFSAMTGLFIRRRIVAAEQLNEEMLGQQFAQPGRRLVEVGMHARFSKGSAKNGS